MTRVRTIAALLALSLAASACADVTQPPARQSIPPAAGADQADLAQAAVAALVTRRNGPFQIFIPSATRTEAGAVVELIRGGSIARYRFVRGADGWEVAEHLGTEREPGPAASGAAAGANPLLDRGTWSTPRLAGTPEFAVLLLANPDGSFPDSMTMQPVQYVTSSSPRRWTQSGQVVTGWEDSFKEFRRVYFFNGSPLTWTTSDSVFTASAHAQWTYGDFLGQQGTCTLPTYNTVCYPLKPRTSGAWVDGYYSITVARRTPTSVKISGPSPLVLAPGDTRQLSATVSDQYGTLSRPVTWSSSNTAVASVSSSGVLTVNDFGTATITATSEGVSGTLEVHSQHILTVVGPTSAVDEYAEFTANARPSGSYYYDWSREWCDVLSDGTRFCSPREAMTSGQDVTTNSEYVSRYDEELLVYVDLRQVAGGPVLASNYWLVRGLGEPEPGEECDDPRRC